MDPQEAFTRHWTLTQGTVASYIHSMVRDYHLAEDLVQEVAVVALRKYSAFDPTRPFVAWVLGIARLLILDQRRRFARSLLVHDSELTAAMAETCVEMSDELDERRPHLRHCLERLGDQHREPLRLFYEEGLAADRIAALLGRSAGAVRTMLSRLRTALQQCIEQRAAEAQA